MFFPGAVYQGARALGFLRVLDGETLLVSSRSAWERHGAAISAHFAREPLETFWVEGEPTSKTRQGFAAACARARYAHVVGVGGGSVMDVAKTAHLFCEGSQTVVIPTTAGSGSEVSRYALFINDAGEKEPLVSSSLLPDVVLYDPSLLVSLSPELTASTSADALTHALEGLTSRLANPLSDLCANEALRLIWSSAPLACREPENLEARRDLELGGFFAGLVQSSASVGLVHGLADFLGPRFGVGHGRAIAALLPPVIALNLARNGSYYAKVSDAGDVAAKTRELYGACGLAELARETFQGASVSLEALSNFLKKDPAAKTHPFLAEESELAEIARAVGIRCV
jgi:alcohol dehydrogenase class IV